MRCISLALALCVASCGSSGETGNSEEAGSFDIARIGNDIFSMLGPPTSPPEMWLQAAEEHCGGKQFCKVMGWTNKANAPTAMPMLNREAQAQVFDYTLNRGTGLERDLYRCDVFKTVGKDKCMATFNDEEAPANDVAAE